MLLTPPATIDIYTLSLHDALPIWVPAASPYNISQAAPLLVERYHISSVRGELPAARLAPLWVTIGSPYVPALGLVTAPSASPTRAPGLTAVTPAVRAALWQPPDESKATRS